jgi:SAM-dependent methyltransferase
MSANTPAIQYGAINTPVLNKIPSDCRRVLDIGCGTGALGAHIKQLNPEVEVVGITRSEFEAGIARKHLDIVLVEDLEACSLESLGSFDCVICSHVLEHLQWPGVLLKRILPLANGLVVVALPNALFWKQRVQFLSGRFDYTSGGLMDETHLRFFSWKTAQSLLTDAGYQLISAEAFGSFPFSRYLGPLRGLVDATSLRLFPGLIGWQFVICARQSIAHT